LSSDDSNDNAIGQILWLSLIGNDCGRKSCRLVLRPAGSIQAGFILSAMLCLVPSRFVEFLARAAITISRPAIVHCKNGIV
jgi:hypothetical protein